MKQTHNEMLPPQPFRQHGFSLVELLVAMVVAVFLLAGMFSVLQGNMDTSTEQTALAQLQDNERFAMSVFTNMIESGGYFPTLQPDGVTLNDLTDSLPVDGSDFPTAGQALSGGSNGAGGDTLISQFEVNPNDGISSCLGNMWTTAGPGHVFKNKLQVDSTQNALTCSDNNGVTAVPIVSGVKSLTVLWGMNTVDANTNTNCPANTYVTTAEFVGATALQQTNICSVMITLTFVNPLYQRIPGGPITPGQQDRPTVTFTKVIAVMGRAGPPVAQIEQ